MIYIYIYADEIEEVIINATINDEFQNWPVIPQISDLCIESSNRLEIWLGSRQQSCLTQLLNLKAIGAF